MHKYQAATNLRLHLNVQIYLIRQIIHYEQKQEKKCAVEKL